MNEVKEVFRNKVFQRVIILLLVFVVGLIAGYEMHKNGISYIQGYTYYSALGDTYDSASDSNASDSNASSSNASSSNASDSNASSSNASSSNASDSNASDSNASSSNASGANAGGVEWLEEVDLNSFSLDKQTVKPGEVVNAIIDYDGFWDNATIVFKNKSTGVTFKAAIVSTSGKFTVPSNTMDGTYEVTDILFTGSRNQYSKYTKQYSKNDVVNSLFFNFKSTLVVKSPTPTTATATPTPKATVTPTPAPGVTPTATPNVTPTPTPNNTPKEEIIPIKITSFKLSESKISKSDKVYVTYTTNKEISSMKLEFTSSSKEKMTVYVQSLNNGAYFDIPSTASTGKYTLTSAVLTGDDVTTAFSNTKNVKDHTYYDFKATLEVTEPAVEETNYNYNNEDMNASLISNLYDAPDNSEITINAHNSPIVNKDVFSSIKGTNKKLIINYNDNQFIFDGKDITDTSKSIDASITVGRTNNDDDIDELVKDSIVVYFGDNGKLPGKAKVRIKVASELQQLLDGKKAYLYCYNESSKNFTYIETDVVDTGDGYYEFEVNHNSKYVLVNEKLSGSLLAKSESGSIGSNITRFLKDNTVYLILIIVAVMIIVLVAVFLMIQKRNKNTNVQQ